MRPGCGSRLLYTFPMQPNLPVAAPLEVEGLRELPWLVHAFSTRTGGVSTVYGRKDDLNLGFTSQDRSEAVETNRRRFVERLRGEWKLITVRQVHSATILRVTGEALPAESEADGLVTDTPGILLGIQTADCVPVLVADPEHRAVGAFHAGWRGTVSSIVEAGIVRMVEAFGSRPEMLIAAVGPSIGACCYQVGEEVKAAFLARFAYGAELFLSSGHVDLQQANRRQLTVSGLLDQNIQVIGDCTSCDPGKYFSYRRDAAFTGRMLSVVGVSAESGSVQVR